MKFPRFTALMLLGVALQFAPSLHAATYRVPEDFATIQDAVNAASAGDAIRVGPGTWCGAVIAKSVNLTGEGKPTITNQGCSGSNAIVGFLLPSAAASGTTIRGFAFAVTSVFPHTSIGVFGSHADLVVVEQNDFQGSLIAVHNGDGSGWQVNHNTIEGSFVGIRFARHCALGTRAIDNSATFNKISEGPVDGNGIWLFAQDGAVIKNNSFDIPTTPNPPYPLFASWGIFVTDDVNSSGCSLTSINSVIVNNDGRNVGATLVVFQDLNGGNGNSVGNQIRGNFGLNIINTYPTNTSFSIDTVKDRSKLLQCDDQGNCS